MRAFFVAFGFFSASIGAAVACSATGDPSLVVMTSGNGGFGTTSTGGASSVGGFGGAAGMSSSTHFTIATGGCTPTCSADLRSVVDCDGNETSCPADQGCGAMGLCVDPCQAAADNQSTIGCEFYSVIPGPETFTRGSCFAAFVANTWDQPITISVDYGGMTLDVADIARTPVGNGQSTTYAPLANGELPAGQIAMLFLALTAMDGDMYKVTCPSSTPLAVDPAIDGSGYGTAFHITTSAPVAAYDIYPFGGSGGRVPSATLLLPTVFWGTNFIAADAYKVDPSILSSGPLEPFIQIVAAEDGTTVTIEPKVPIVQGTNVAAAPAGQSTTYMVDKGQVLQFLQEAELAGSVLASDKPISVWGGSACMQIPVGQHACDSGHQELLPIQSLGNEYAAVRYPDRGSTHESVPWTIIGVAATPTQLTYDPAPPSGAPTTLMNGDVFDFNASDPFVVTSQDADHPFYLASHMTGGDAAGGLGDPEYVSAVPGPQFLDRYLFMTDPTYGYTNLVFVRKKVAKKFADVSLDCAGTLAGWTPIGSGGLYEYTYVNLVDNWAPQGGCDNGVHTANSDQPFGLTVWGWDNYTSYAYPAGVGTKAINAVVVTPK